MPTYDYKCEKCGHTFEESLKIADREIPTESPCEKQVHRAAPICGGEVKQIIVSACQHWSKIGYFGTNKSHKKSYLFTILG